MAAEQGIEAVVLQPAWSPRLFEALAGSSEWALAHVEGRAALFVRAAQGPALSAFAGDRAAFVRAQRAVDPLLSESLVPAGRALLEAGAADLAAALFEAAAAEAPGDARVFAALGSCYAVRAQSRERAGDPGFREDYRAARERFERALALDPEHAFARRSLEHLRGRTGGEPAR
jgi:tetratricopeptide (TPR) repeat protein